MYMDKTYPNACIVVHMELYRYVLVAPKLALSLISPTIQGTSPNIGKHVLFLKSKIHMTPIWTLFCRFPYGFKDNVYTSHCKDLEELLSF